MKKVENLETIKELTLMLMYLTAIEQKEKDRATLEEFMLCTPEELDGLAEKPVHMTFNIYHPDAIEQLSDEKLINHRFGSARSILNDDGIAKAKELMGKYNI